MEKEYMLDCLFDIWWY